MNYCLSFCYSAPSQPRFISACSYKHCPWKRNSCCSSPCTPGFIPPSPLCAVATRVVQVLEECTQLCALLLPHSMTSSKTGFCCSCDYICASPGSNGSPSQLPSSLWSLLPVSACLRDAPTHFLQAKSSVLGVD